MEDVLEIYKSNLVFLNVSIYFGNSNYMSSIPYSKNIFPETKLSKGTEQEFSLTNCSFVGLCIL